MTDRRKLVEEYSAAWARFDQSLRELQAAVDRGEDRDSESLLLRVELSRLRYSAARNRLAADMLHSDLPNAVDGKEGHIREAAHLLWELAGRPQGTAESDWLRAENLVQRAEITAS